MSWATGSGGISNHGPKRGLWAFMLNEDLSVEIVDGSVANLKGGSGK